MSKWSLGGLEFVLGYPIDALIGFIIGTVVDISKKQTTTLFPNSNYLGQRRIKATIGDIKEKWLNAQLKMYICKGSIQVY